MGRLASAYVRGLQAGGLLATLKHFPGHGDTDVDSHLGLPIVRDPRETIDSVELPPFRAGIAAGADAVMTAHIEMPALDPTPNTPTTLSEPIVGGVLRKELGFGGLIYTDSMGMAGVTALYKPGEAAVRAVRAGNDIVLHSPDDAAAFAAIKAAVESREISAAQIDASVERIMRAKAREGLHRTRSVNLEAIPTVLGSRAPEDAIVLCPKQAGCPYPEKDLAACGISLQLARVLLEGSDLFAHVLVDLTGFELLGEHASAAACMDAVAIVGNAHQSREQELVELARLMPGGRFLGVLLVG